MNLVNRGLESFFESMETDRIHIKVVSIGGVINGGKYGSSKDIRTN